MSDLIEEENTAEGEKQAQPAWQSKRAFPVKAFIGGLALGVGVAAIAAVIGVSLWGIKKAGPVRPDAAKETAQDGVEEVLGDTVIEKAQTLEELLSEMYLEEMDTDAMAEGVYKGMVEALGDPYTVYYDKEETEALEESINGRYSGIGATLSQAADTLELTIIKCFEETPAMEAGLQPGDVIVEVDGTEVTGMDTSAAVALIKGEEGTDVTLKIYRAGEPDYLTKVLTRRKIDIPTVASSMMEDGIGYIQISSFDDVTTGQFAEAMDSLEKQGMQALIIDLRDNPGGRLDIVLDIAEQFVPKGLLVYTEDKNGQRTEYNSESSESEIFGKPLAVLVNGNSASASEILSGAVKDRGAGTVVGTTTYGKGVVQQLLDLQDGTLLKVTISKYFTPAGNDINHKGITPDVEVELPDEIWTKPVITKEDDTQLQKALEVLRGQLGQ